jgi:predicted O-methyltransferase YrrM
MDITDYILSRTNRIAPEPEVTNSVFEMFNTGGVEVEVAEFLYSLVRVQKPNFILETGTHKGISTLYMALALEKNQVGSISTYEIIAPLQLEAIDLWRDLEVSHRIASHLLPSLQAVGDETIDILFLDSEPQYRFDEFLYFWSRVSSGGLILIHDLSQTLGKSGYTHAGMNDWPYGPWREKLESFVSKHEVQIIYAASPRGLTILQKTTPSDENIKLLLEKE